MISIKYKEVRKVLIEVKYRTFCLYTRISYLLNSNSQTLAWGKYSSCNLSLTFIQTVTPVAEDSCLILIGKLTFVSNAKNFEKKEFTIIPWLQQLNLRVNVYTLSIRVRRIDWIFWLILQMQTISFILAPDGIFDKISHTII